MFQAPNRQASGATQYDKHLVHLVNLDWAPSTSDDKTNWPLCFWQSLEWIQQRLENEVREQFRRCPSSLQAVPLFTAKTCTFKVKAGWCCMQKNISSLATQRYTATRRMIWWSRHTYFILIEEHLQLPHTDTQIGLVELVGDVPAQRSKLAALLDQSVEEAQAVQHLVEVDLRRHTTHWSPPTSPNLSWILLSLMQLHREHLPITIILTQWNVLMKKRLEPSEWLLSQSQLWQ